MRYNLLEENKFYFAKGNQKISYRLIYSYLLKMVQNNEKKREIILDKCDEKTEDNKAELELIYNKDYYFQFKIDLSSKLIIEGKKKIYFQDDDEEKSTKEIYVYNTHQIKEFQSSLLSNKNINDICLFDEYETLIEDETNLFNRVIFLKKKEDNLIDQKMKEEYYKKIFNNYLTNKFENEGERFSFNISEYSGQQANNFEYFETKKRRDFLDSLDDFIESEKYYLALTGISGTGKTITLLKFLKEKYINFPNCYFNIKSLSKNSNIKKIAAEFVKLFNKNDYYEYYIELINLFEKEKHIMLWDKIIKILNYIIEIKEIKEKIIIIFDQYKIGFDINLKLLNILQSDKYCQKIKIIICSSINGKDIKTNLTYSTIFKNLQMKNIINYTFIERLFSVKLIIKNDKIKAIMKKFKYIPKYYFIFIKDYHEDTENIDNEEELQKQIKRFVSDQFNNIKNKLILFYNENNIELIENYNNICRILQGEAINESYFTNYIQIIPLKYCKFKIENGQIQIFASFNFFYGPLRAVYKEMTNLDLISVGKITKNRGELGNIFDSLVNYHFDVNKNAFGFDISHVIIVNEIVNFSYFTFIINDDKDYFIKEINLEKLFDGKPIYLEQMNSNGQCVDGGFLLPIKNTNFYSLLLYQSSIKKRKHFSKEFIYDYIYLTSKENLNKMFGIKIQKLYFMYILDSEDLSTIKHCKDNNIFYIFYDFKSSKFYFNNNKVIASFSKKILDSLEIQKPNLKIIEQIDKLEINNDITEIKKILLNQKRNPDKENEKVDSDKPKNNESINEEDNNIINIKENIEFIENKKGYTKDKVEFINVNMKEYEKKKKKKQKNIKVLEKS